MKRHSYRLCISGIVSLLLGIGLGISAHAQAQSTRALEEKLSHFRVSVNFKGRPLSEVLDFLSNVSGIDIVVHPELIRLEDDRVRSIHLRLRDLPLDHTLDLLADLTGTRRVWKRGVILFVNPKRLQPPIVQRVYDIRDLMITLKDFPGPKIRLSDEQPTSHLFHLEDEPEKWTPQSLIDIVRQHLGGWEEDRRTRIGQIGGHLLVRHHADAHQRLEVLLQSLRR
ncbi:MAG: hypothetical protein QF752_07430 [Planctomycetota bacterium]|nr:hypothetical protein [Planctomycetota bacterium]